MVPKHLVTPSEELLGYRPALNKFSRTYTVLAGISRNVYEAQMIRQNPAREIS